MPLAPYNRWKKIGIILMKDYICQP